MARASITARGVAGVRRRVARVPFDGGQPEVDERLSRAVGMPFPLPIVGLSGAYFRERTRFFDQAVVDAIGDGIQQIVVIGAGYDGRAFRYRSPGVRWFEVDHPATQAGKRAQLDALADGGSEVDRSHITFVPCDLSRDDVGTALADAGHDASHATLFVAEAVLPYVPPDAVERVLQSLGERRGRLAVELGLVPHDLQARLNLRALRTMTGLLGEPIRTMHEPDDAIALLRRCGWTPREPDPSLGRGGQGRIVLWLLAE